MVTILKNSIFRNFFFLLAANIIVKVIGFFTSVVVARSFSVEEYGVYRWYSVLLGYLVLTINFGFDVYFYNLYFQKKFPLEKILAIQLKTRFIFGSLIYLFTIFIGSHLIYNIDYKVTFYILMTQLISFVFDIQNIFRIKEKFVFMSVLMISNSLINLFFTIIIVNYYTHIAAVALIVTITNFISNLIMWIYLNKTENFYFSKILNWMRKMDFKYLMKHLRKSFVINLSFLMISIYYNLDSLMLGIIKGSKDVAIYSIAYNFLLLAIIPTQMLYTAFSPTLAQSVYKKEVFFGYVKATTILGVVVFIFLLLSHKHLILIPYGEKYSESVDVLFYLSFDVIPCYLAGAFANPINIWGDYKNYLIVVSVGAIINFILNLVLIPKYGINCAIISTILAEVFVFLTALIYWIKFRGKLI